VNDVSGRANWAQLFRVACALVRQANSEQIVIDHWTLGGGTAMMLQIDHRESHDIDIFLNDPQQLPFLDPQKQDFEFEIQPDGYEGDGIRSPKLVFGIGEIDFIVAGALTSSPTTEHEIEGEIVQLETIPEIVTKKVFYRGSNIMPRDVFDIAAAGERSADAIIEQLRLYKDQVTQTLAAMEKMNPKFVSDSIADLVIRDQYRELAKTALEKCKKILRAV
jgi:Nucleotidyl transferase AbiEii toxin, Type IV TA system